MKLSGSQPLVSVLMTAYNREQYIAEAIQSVLGSTYANFELIIVDDCSSDKTVEIAKIYEKSDPRIKVYINEKNLGDYPNRNRASTYASGEYIMFADSDDKLNSDGISYCINAMLSYPQSNFGMYSINSQEKISFLSSEDSVKKHFFEKPFLTVGPGGTIIRRIFFESISKYPEKYGPANDMYFNLKAAAAGGVVLLPYAFLYYRIHDGQQLNLKYNYLYNNYRYLNDALLELSLPLNKHEIRWLHKKNKRRFTVNLIKYYLKTRNISKVKNAIHIADFKFKDALIGVFHF